MMVTLRQSQRPVSNLYNKQPYSFRDVEFEGIAGKEPSICVFRILDVDTGEVKYKIRGKESHCAENGKYPFSISTEYLDKIPDYPEINSYGIYIL